MTKVVIVMIRGDSSRVGDSHEGTLTQPLTQGQCLTLNRIRKNGKASTGFWTTSRVQSIHKINKTTCIFRTKNSIYKLCRLTCEVKSGKTKWLPLS